MDKVELKQVSARTWEVYCNGTLHSRTGRKQALFTQRLLEDNSKTIADATPALAAWCREMADKYEGLAAEAAYQTWRKYSRECQTGDQSAIFSECEQWYFKGKFPLSAEGRAMAEFDALLSQ